MITSFVFMSHGISNIKNGVEPKVRACECVYTSRSLPYLHVESGVVPRRRPPQHRGGGGRTHGRAAGRDGRGVARAAAGEKFHSAQAHLRNVPHRLNSIRIPSRFCCPLLLNILLKCNFTSCKLNVVFWSPGRSEWYCREVGTERG